jgi:hypothetical protein
MHDKIIELSIELTQGPLDDRKMNKHMGEELNLVDDRIKIF